MSEKKRFKEPMLIKHEEKLDKVTMNNQLGSNTQNGTSPKKNRWHRGRHLH